MSLIATDLSVTLRGRRLLDGIAFEAQPGQLTSIVGPNGSGKTTLLRALTGELAFDGAVQLGQLSVAGAEPWRLAAWRAVLPQATVLAFPFTVAEVVRLGRPGDPDAVPGLLARVGLAGYEGRFYQELSGGEQQRVQLARVLAQIGAPLHVGRARWLFLDEPVSALDIGHQLQVMQMARDFADAGGGVIAVMHDLNLTAMFSDAVLLLKDGQLLGQGAPREVLTDALLSRAYDCPVRVGVAPGDGVFLLPQATRGMSVA